MALESTNRLVTVVGASGFVGRYVVQELCGLGLRVRAVCRNAAGALFLKPLGGLGQVQIAAADITRPQSLAAVIEGSHAVINLVGVLDGDVDSVHADGAEALARAARDAGVSSFVQVSAIGADPQSPSRYGRSKAEGEARVKAALPSATIIRPSVIFGTEDNFINRFARLAKYAPVVPVIRGDVRLQPLWVRDVARAVALAVADPRKYGGKTFELGGPRSYRFKELVEWIADTIRCRRPVVQVPDPVARLIAAFDFLPCAPITRDQLLMLSVDNVVAKGARGIDSFGIAPMPLETVAPDYLVQYRRHGRFNVAATPGVR